MATPNPSIQKTVSRPGRAIILSFPSLFPRSRGSRSDWVLKANSLLQPLPQVRLPHVPSLHSLPHPSHRLQSTSASSPCISSLPGVSPKGDREPSWPGPTILKMKDPVPGDSHWHRPQSRAEPLAQPRAAPVVCPFLSLPAPRPWALASVSHPLGSGKRGQPARAEPAGRGTQQVHRPKERILACSLSLPVGFQSNRPLLPSPHSPFRLPSASTPLRASGPGGLPGAPSRWWWVWRTGLAPGPGWAGRRAGIPGMRLRLPAPGPTCSGLQIPSPPRPGLSTPPPLPPG